ncbi:hypothetical protein Btru_054411 [Bulinus truncatus]|nr:hypothetical protein Btru_054411 [Bulinus truncatus]
MKVSFVFLFLSIIVAILSDATYSVQSKEVALQQPLMFGRRGMNPNLNSLFFGKRSSSADPLISIRELRRACSILTNYMDTMEAYVSEEDS